MIPVDYICAYIYIYIEREREIRPSHASNISKLIHEILPGVHTILKEVHEIILKRERGREDRKAAYVAIGLSLEQSLELSLDVQDFIALQMIDQGYGFTGS